MPLYWNAWFSVFEVDVLDNVSRDVDEGPSGGVIVFTILFFQLRCRYIAI